LRMISLTLWSFVAAEVFLGLGEDNVLSELLAVLLKRQLFRSVHCVFAGVINALARLFADQTNNFALIASLSHFVNLLYQQSY